MKLGSLPNGARDGTLVIVSRDLRRAVSASDIAPSLLDALERWPEVEERLVERAHRLERDSVASEPFDAGKALAPLPRSPDWLDGSVFKNHTDLMGKAFNVPPDQHAAPVPLMYQGASDDFISAHQDVILPSEEDGLDFEAEIGIVTDRAPMGTTAEAAAKHVKLVLLLNDVSLRAKVVFELKRGFGWIHAKATTSFTPVAVTPDELGDAWADGKLNLPIHVHYNGEAFGHPSGGEMTYSFHELIAYPTYARNLAAGTIIGSGTVSNRDYERVGSACIAERRAIEQIKHGAPRTGFMRFGDRVRIEMFDAHGQSIFGAIDQRYAKLGAAA